MMRSLYAGVAGLRTHQTKMDVIGNNIANVNTTAYKSQSVTFRDLMYQTTQKASGANAETGVGGTNAKQIGLGVVTGAINTAIAQQGSAQTTNNPFDIMITGDAFFVVSNGMENFFTRDGSFYVDGAGNLAMTSTGYNVMGWKVDETTGEPKSDTVTALRIMDDTNKSYPAEATSEARVTGIIDKNDTKVNSAAGRIMNLEFYDNQGYKYTAKMSVHGTTTDGNYYVQLDDILDSNGKSIGEDAMNEVAFGESLDVAVSQAYTLVNGSADGSGIITIKSGSNTYAGATVGNQVTTIPASGTPELAALKAAYPSIDFSLVTSFTIDGKGTLTVDTVSSGTIPAAVSAVGGTFSTENIILTSGATSLTLPVGAQNMATIDKVAIKTLYGLDIDAEGVNEIEIAANGTLTVTNRTVEKAANLVYNTGNGNFVSVNGNGAGTMSLSFGNNPKFSTININFSNSQSVNNNGSSTIAATSGTVEGLGAGRKIGEMIAVSIGKDGIIYASYDNGMSKCLGQIATAVFANPSGLEKQGDNLYSATMNSGAFDGIGVDITADGGYMSTGVLEMSNVDLSAEFTEMITTQRGFQANSRIITVSDTMLEELTNLKR
ncbi:flagellar hook protein FlgE [Kineothrix sp. MB12-C1]|uniref:flagellar hook protein FlgE n=1 Tax=Kineothrix sp. MB12-C1 TaxID=3070215 RepID=UPI0027D2E255|nr:flagellar hook-basal body complex protein [Kineothrix sp. MB12-C1]WMC93012.1 flagellar hook-basal body complex protein [Kineothrix sp. MB12-C1]